MSKHTFFYKLLFFTFSLFTIYSCTKINDATTLGLGLIPSVDNVNTFDTTLSVLTYNGQFTSATDSTNDYALSSKPLGLISNDPLFGKTDARLFFELKPSYFPFAFINRPDSIALDSVVLVLDYQKTYGDSTQPQTVNVYEVAQSQVWNDSTYYYPIRTSTIAKSSLLGSKTFVPSSLNDSVKVYKDTTAKQLRIRLNNSFGQRLLRYDTTGINNAYTSDSIFRTFFKGFALECVQGNSIMNFSLTGANTKLAIYYRDLNGGAAVQDTTVAYFTHTSISGASTYIVPTPGTSPYATATANTSLQQQDIYIQSAPGSYGIIKIPGLSSLSNRVVHRAELIMEQIYDPSNLYFTPPDYLYVDAYDSTNNYYKAIPYDFIFDFTYGSANFGTLGSVPVNTVNTSGNAIKVWNYQLTRYVQNIVNGRQKNLTLRVFAPHTISERYQLNNTDSQLGAFIVNSNVAQGRVKLGGGARTTQKMRLRIIYSKI